MAPEQCRGEPVDARGDQFGFCASLYEALYGQRAFAGDSPDAVIDSILAGTIREPPADTKVPGWVRRILLRGLRVDKEERWPSMDALLAALGHDPAGAGGAGSARRRRSWRRRPCCSPRAISAASEARLCEGAERHLAGVWDAARREAVQRAFARSGKPWAAQAAVETTRALDGYAPPGRRRTATPARRRAFAAKRPKRSWGCAWAASTIASASWRALTDLFAIADDETVERSVQAVAALPPVSVCADVKTLVDGRAAAGRSEAARHARRGAHPAGDGARAARRRQVQRGPGRGRARGAGGAAARLPSARRRDAGAHRRAALQVGRLRRAPTAPGATRSTPPRRRGSTSSRAAWPWSWPT